jgi:hypothetical protein
MIAAFPESNEMRRLTNPYTPAWYRLCVVLGCCVEDAHCLTTWYLSRSHANATHHLIWPNSPQIQRNSGDLRSGARLIALFLLAKYGQLASDCHGDEWQRFATIL